MIDYIGKPIVRLFGYTPYDESEEVEADEPVAEVTAPPWSIGIGPRSEYGHMGDALESPHFPLITVHCSINQAALTLHFPKSETSFQSFSESAGTSDVFRYTVYFDFPNEQVEMQVMVPDLESDVAFTLVSLWDNVENVSKVDRFIQLAFFREQPFTYHIKGPKGLWFHNDEVYTDGTRDLWLEANNVDSPPRAENLKQHSDECLKFGT